MALAEEEFIDFREWQPKSIELAPLTMNIGTEIHGVDLAKPLPPEQISDIKGALNRWKVVFFRDQFIDHAGHVAFARQLGDPTPGHAIYGAHEGFPEIYEVSKKRMTDRFDGEPIHHPWNWWHTDLTCAKNPPYASILRAELVPPYGGDTQFTNLCAAYEALSPVMKKFLEGLRGIHHKAPQDGVKAKAVYTNKNQQTRMVAEHPLVRIHPETGEKVLFVSPNFLHDIVGLSPTETKSLLELLKGHAVEPEFTCRFKWEPGSIAVWDNRATCHYPPRDIYRADCDFDRCFYRITLMGPIAYGVDGRESEQLEGTPLSAV
ncbi:MAG TPA: taurine dioxygenase [Rhodospirillaceae bacterium]|nr:taurine dioxygenase [Rhodospirillaceae bacterium]